MPLPTATGPAPLTASRTTAKATNCQLDATASVPGTFVYTPPAGTVLPVGTQTLSVTFTPTDSVHYAVVTKTVTIVVRQAHPRSGRRRQ